MLNDNIFEILLQIANRYNLQLKCSYDKTYCNRFLIEEEKTEFRKFFIEKTYRNKLYVDVTSNDTYIEIYSNKKRLCHIKIYKEEEVDFILRYIKRHLKDCRKYCDFLYNFAMVLRRINSREEW